MNHPAEHPSEGSKVILIVEDDADIADILIRTLQSETSYQVSWVPDGLQAVKVAETIKPQLFILDYNLPQMNGMEVYRRLRAIEGLDQTPVLFMSANPRLNEAERQKVTVLRKPFEVDELLRTINKLLA